MGLHQTSSESGVFNVFVFRVGYYVCALRIVRTLAFAFSGVILSMSMLRVVACGLDVPE